MGKVVSKVTDAVGLTDFKAGDRANAAQGAATAAANKLQKEMYYDNASRSQPYISQGQLALSDMVNLNRNSTDFSRVQDPLRDHSGRFSMDDFQADPGYQFRMDEGQKAIERGAAARGGLNSGATMKALMNYGQNMASNEYQNAYNRFNQDYSNAYNRYNNDTTNKFNRLNTLANYGMSAIGNLGGAGASMANSVSNNLVGMGNAQAANEISRHQNGMGGLIQTGLGVASMFCWVARAVFGETNLKWLMAREFVLNMSPEWFKSLYLKHGESLAKKVEKSNFLKLALRPIFEVFAFLGAANIKRGMLCQ